MEEELRKIIREELERNNRVQEYRLYLYKESEQVYVSYVPFVPQIGYVFCIDVTGCKSIKNEVHDVKVKDITIDLPREYLRYEPDEPIDIVCEIEILD